MTKPQVQEINIATDEITFRDFTNTELQEVENAIQQNEIIKNLKEEAKVKRQTLLDKLGITEEEAKLLLSQKGM